MITTRGTVPGFVPRVRHVFDVLGSTVSLEGPPGLVEPIAVAYRRFLTNSQFAGTPDDPTPSINGVAVEPLAGLLLQAQVYRAFLLAIQDAVRDRALFHGACLVGRSGRALLIAAPSGFGKTSLTLELLARGWKLLSDDYAPLDLATGLVDPYPRTIGLIPGSSAPVPPVFERAAADPDATHFLGKALLDVGRVLGPGALATGPAPLGTIALLAPSLDDAGVPAESTQLVMVRASAAEDFRSRIGGIPGVDVTSAPLEDAPDLAAFHVTLRHDALPTERLAPVLAQPDVLHVERLDDLHPDFSCAPQVRTIPRRAAALELAREMFNRREGQAFLGRYGARLAPFVFDLLGALAGVRCLRVCPGPLQETASLVEAHAEPS